MTDLPDSLPTIFERNAALHGDRPALLGEGLPPASHRQLWEQAQAVAGRLRALGIGRGDRVAIMLPQGPEAASAFLAVACAATAAPLNPAYGQSECAFYLEDLRAKAIIVPQGAHSPARAAALALGVPVLELAPDPAGAGLFGLWGETGLAPSTDALAGPEDTALVLHTSGTTARPKIVPLSHANLCASAGHIGATLGLGQTDVCLNLMPLFHIHGLLACVLASLAHGGATVCGRSNGAAAFLTNLGVWKPTWYSAVPTLHQAILAEAARLPQPLATSLRFIRSSSAALPPRVFAELEATFGVPVIEAYGMTEAAHQMASNPLPPGVRKPGSVGLAAGPEVAILDGAGAVLPPGGTGEIVIRGANVTAGYENNPEANAQAWSNGWFRTGDLGHLDDDGYLFISGRLKEQINRGGEKISPREIDEALLAHPSVHQAVAFAMPHPTLGEDVAAAVVLRAGASVDEAQLRAFALERLPDFKAPTRIIVLAEIPKGATGKVQRIGLAAKLQDALAVVHDEPATELERQVAAAMGEALGWTGIGRHDNFFMSGGDSLGATRVLARLCRLLGRDLPAGLLFRLPTPALLAAHLEAPPKTVATDYPRDATVHQLVEAQAARTPDAVAVEYGGQQLTYRELNGRANQLAQHLRALGVGADSLVGLCTDRSSDMIVGLLGILKAGGAYIPFDPDFPPARLAFMAEDAAVSVLVAQRGVADRLGPTSAQRVWLDDFHGQADAPDPAPLADSLSRVCVLYTSGSTGRPKGVELPHRGLVNCLWHFKQALPATAQDVFLALTTFSFDIAGLEIWLPLITGARCVVAPAGAALDIGFLSGLMRESGVTVAQATPSVWRLFKDAGWQPSRPMTLISGGEALAPDLAQWLTSAGAAWNAYGPTETTIYSTANRLRPGDPITIGFPLANTSLHVLDPAGQPVPAGVAGELFIGGDGLARGYLGRAELTAEKFVEGPGGAKLYRTGDSVRQAPSGELAWLGRLDGQVKIRGLRIEVGEVEAALMACRGVRAAAVAAQPDGAGSAELAAWLVGDPVAPPDASGMAARLRGQLPGYMVPSRFFMVHALPLTPNGKVDRQALGAMAVTPLEKAPAEQTAPRNDLERALAGIWCEVLRCGRVGIHDNFFDLGGHSLLLMQVCARVRKQLGLKLSVRVFFDSPTVAGQAKWMAGMAGAAGVASACRIPRAQPLNVRDASGVAVYPASSGQARMWFMQQYASGMPVYNTAHAFHLAGPLDADLLADALGRVTLRHDMLRTAFEMTADGLVQCVVPSAGPALRRVDLTDEPAQTRHASARRLLDEAAAAPFDLGQSSQRALLVRLDAREHVLLLMLHHIVSDGWSVANLSRELSAAYGGLPLAPLPVQYADYAAWQQAAWAGGALDEHGRYWLEKLAGDILPLELPADRPRPLVESFRGAALSTPLAPDLLERLKACAHGEGATLPMILLAAYKVLLHRHTGQDDLVVGMLVANRQQTETEPLIGFFVNTLPMRTQLAGAPTFRELLQRVKETAVGAYEHQDMPLERMLDLLRIRRDAGRSPLFQTLFSAQDFPGAELGLPGIQTRDWPIGSRTSKYDLSLFVERCESGWQTTLEYASDLFDADRIGRMLGHWQVLLESIAADPGRSIATLPMLTEGERVQLSAWNQTQAQYPRDLAIHQLVEAVVARTPEAVAVEHEGQLMTYRELNGRANQLAHHLRTLGVGPDVPVGLCVERSPDAIVGLLGILKAGGAYVPFDPEFPAARLAFMAENAELKVLVAQRSTAGRLPPLAAQPVFLDEYAWGAQTPNPEPLSDSRSLACVLYTSGSSGRPKGVEIPHRASVNFLWHFKQALPMGPEDICLALATFTFDIAGLEIWLPLISGARCVMAPGGAVMDTDRLARLLGESRVTVAQATPVTWRMLQESGWTPGAHMKLISCGEALPQDLSDWMTATGAAAWNGYGPTETTYVTAKKLHHGGPVTIGLAMANSTLHVLDPAGEPVPVGVPGELFIGGDSVTRGYRRRPDLTGERFVSGPGGERVYRTGDRVRRLPSGELAWLDRLDGQVKIRGLRIEAGEVEAALRTCPGVQASAVAVCSNAHGQSELTAWLVGESAVPLNAPSLAARLREQLPAHMVPSRFFMVTALPLTPNGKLDRRALAAMASIPLEGPAAEHAEPRNDLERALAVIWREVLGCDRIGIHDNFFDLGGHSLRVMQACARVRKQMGRELPIRSFFQSPTIAGQAECLAGMAGAAEVASACLIPRAQSLNVRDASGVAVYPASSSQTRMWFMQQHASGMPVYNTAHAFHLAGPLDADLLADALGRVTLRHDMLRTAFEMTADGLVQRVVPSAGPALRRVDLTDEPVQTRHASARRLLDEAAAAPFDLAQSSQRALLVRLDTQEYVLLLMLHHIISDGWSRANLSQELSAAYGGLPLAPLPVQYAGYAARQQAAWAGGALEKNDRYWLEKLAGDIPPPELPADRPRPPVKSFRGAILRRPIAPDLLERLKARASEEGATLLMILLAAHKTLLFRYTRQEDLVVGVPIANRQRVEAEPLIGLFANILAMRTSLAGAPTFRELLRRVKETSVSAYEHQDMPLERLVDLLHVRRDAGRSPLFQTAFSLQDFPEIGLKLPGITARNLDIETHTAKFDFSLAVERSESGWRTALEYATDLFDADRIERMLGHWQVLLESIAADPDRPIATLPLLTAAEGEQMAGWNQTAADYPRDATVHQLVEAQAARTPDAVAVTAGGQSLSYRELNGRANLLAHHLRALGVGPEVLVGLCTGRSVEMVVGLLGILKAGGAYVPLDPDFPAARLAFMVQDAELAAVVAQRAAFAVLPPMPVPVLWLDDLAAEGEAANPGTLSDSGTLAYVLYTSGSTGQPKGVEITHRSLINCLWHIKGSLPVGPGDVWLALTTLSFDMSAREIWLPLIAGACCAIAPREAAMDAGLLGRLLADSGATLLQTTPVSWRLLKESGFRPASGTKLLSGGEALAPDLADWMADAGAAAWNCYGPTETTLCCTMKRLRAGQPVTIGTPMANVTLRVLDPHGQPMPVGIPGELFIGGDGVARGYWRRAKLTAERFITDPDGRRHYRTGDCVRRQPTGELEFIGRLDGQLKIRGQRIEAGEVEAALRGCPGVLRVAVAAHPPGAVVPELAAWVVGDPAAPPEASALAARLRGQLPPHMVPSRFFAVAALPLTPNGKLDRKALAAMAAAPLAMAAAPPAEPRNDLERALVGIWREVLRRESVGIHDPFFDWGGHSLLVMQVCARVREQLGLKLSERTFFEFPTIAGQAQCLASAPLAPGTAAPADDPSGPDAQGRTRIAGTLPVACGIARARPLGTDRAGGTVDFPASGGQERLWFVQQLAPGSPVYNSPQAFHLTGPLEAAALEEAVNQVVRRHDTLRTGLVMTPQGLVQRVFPFAFAPLPRADLAGMPAADRKAAAKHLVDEAAATCFDLEKPLFRALWVQLGSQESVLLCVLHHAVSDGWSWGNFARDLSAFYDAVKRAAPLPCALPIQYADYAAWQRNFLADGALEEQSRYWAGRLAGDLPPLELPADRPRPPVESFRGAKCAKPLDAGLLDRLRLRAREEGATLPMLLLAAYNTLLYRHCGQEEVAVGMPVANRQHVEAEGLIGFFVNTLVMRTSLAGAPTFRELLRRVKEASLEAYTHQDMPLDRLVELLRIPRDAGRSALFQTFFAFQDFPEVALAFPGMVSRPWPVETRTAKLDISWFVERDGSGWRTSVEYATDLFDAARIERMLGHWHVLLEGVAADPDLPLTGLPLLTEPESSRLSAWNQTQTDCPLEKGIHQLFAEQAARTPDAVAIVSGEESLTYRELGERAGRVAAHLRGMGVGHGDVVGIAMDRCAGMVTCMLGALLAGAAYWAIEENLPEDRLRGMLADARPRAVLAGSHAPEHLAGACRAAGLPAPRAFDGLLASAALAPAPAAPPERPGDAPAYINYTSGSTGRPKAVLVPHRGVVRLVRNTDYASLGPSDAVAHASNPAFDASTFEIWGALLNGARLCILPRDTLLQPARLAGAIRDNGLTTLFLTTALFNQVAELLPSAFAPLRHLLFGGEACNPASVRRVLEAGGPARLLHVYGPTETTTFATWEHVTRVGSDDTAIPIGRPIANTSVHLLDKHGQAVPVGVPGEIHIGGPGVALGYLGQPELTAQKFISDPFSNAPGARLYRTGDQGRWTEGGRVEFLGRRDGQVKIRGFRVELGEVEAALRDCPGVADAAVSFDAAADGAPRLAAFLAVVGAAPSMAVLRARLAETLPPYMVPETFAVLPALPLTANGKVDRRALAQAAGAALPQDSAGAAPRNALERDLLRIWQDVLRQEGVGIHHSFFDLGGHSLLVVQVCARLHTQSGLELPISAFFKHPTIAGQAGFLAGAAPVAAGGSPEAAPAAAGVDEYPASPIQERLWFMQQYAPESPLYNVPQAFHLAGPLDRAALAAALAGVVRRHDALRTRFAMTPGGLVQRVDPFAGFELEEADLSGEPEAARQTAAAARLAALAEAPQDLSRPPRRFLLVRLSDSEHILFGVLHHIISDGWSGGRLAQDLSAFYRAARGLGPPPAPLAIQYGDHALWQRRWLAGGSLDKQIRYWAGQLADPPPPLDLPTDRPRPPVESFRGDDLSRPFPPELMERLRARARECGATLSMLLLAAYKVLLHRHCGQEDLMVGMPIANRQRVETEPLIGVFINTLVLRTSLAGGPTFRELLGRVKQTAVDAYTHPDLPLERLMELLAVRRDASRAPLFQTTFSMQNYPAVSLDLPGLSAGPWPTSTRTSKFDLGLSVERSPGGWQTTLNYATDLFDADRMGRMLGHWQTLLEGIAADPDLAIGALPLLTADEQAELAGWNRTQADCPGGATLAELVGAQAARTPDAVAVACEGQRLSYRELDRRANRLAHHLRTLGVGPEVLVGLCAARSVEMVVGLLGILKAGGAYVPLDPDFPAARLAFMAQDAEFKVVVAGRAVADALPPSSATQVWLEDWAGVDGVAKGPPATAGPDSPAYVLYTSGSSGQPKGVEITHRALVNCLWDFKRRLPAGPADVWLALTTLSFDIAGLEIWLPLVCGARCEVVSRETAMDAAGLRRALEESAATILQATPVSWQMLREAGWRPAPGMKLLCGGEAMPPGLGEWLAGSGAAAWNVYGPTETTIWSTACRLRPGEPVNIGSALANTTLHVLDRHGHPVPVGVPGELLIGGDGVARGYRRRPELTADRFVAGPDGRRAYRTGDLVRRRPSGELEWLARLDGQIKVRGHRIEVGEIEAALRTHPQIREAVAGIGADASGGKHLAAWLVAGQDGLPEAFALAAHLRARLPEYMVPSRFTAVEAMPLTPNGKVDRRALAGMEGALLESAPAADRTAPRSVLERDLAAIWREVLGRAEVGIHDNFFDLGGHSLLVIRACAAMREKLGLEVPVRMFFQSPTIAGQAGQLAGPASATSPAMPAGHMVTLQEGDAGKPLLVILPGGTGGDKELLVFAKLLRSLPAGQPVAGINLELFNPPGRGLLSVPAIAARLLADLRAQAGDRPLILLGECVAGGLAFEMARQAAVAGRPAAGLILFDAIRPNWQRGWWWPMRDGLDALRPAGWLAFLKSPLRHLSAFRARPPATQKQKHLRILWRYRPGSLSQPADLFVTRELTGRFGTDLGWRRFAPGLRRHWVEGTHDLYIREPTPEMITALAAILAAAEPFTPPPGPS